MLRTEKGTLVEIRVDGASARPHQMARYELQGTKASYCTSTNAGLDPLIWIEGRSPETKTGAPTEWESLFKYAEEFEHPLWREHMAAARQAGHGGGDFFTLREFTQAIREQRAPLIDVYDAVTWSALTPLSQESVRLNNSSVPYPRFK